MSTLEPQACTAQPQAPSRLAYPPQTGAGATTAGVGGQRESGSEARPWSKLTKEAPSHTVSFLPPAPYTGTPHWALSPAGPQGPPSGWLPAKKQVRTGRESSWQRAPRCGRSELLPDGAALGEIFLPSSSVLSNSVRWRPRAGGQRDRCKGRPPELPGCSS